MEIWCGAAFFYVNYKRLQALQNKSSRIIEKHLKNVDDATTDFKFLRQK